METLQSLVILLVVIAVAFLAAKLVMDAELHYLMLCAASEGVTLDELLAGPEPEPEQEARPQLRLVWSGPAVLGDEPYDQMKDLAL
jgi:hypothetical protein